MIKTDPGIIWIYHFIAMHVIVGNMSGVVILTFIMVMALNAIIKNFSHSSPHIYYSQHTNTGMGFISILFGRSVNNLQIVKGFQQVFPGFLPP